jgi:tRNA(fMet)-specific endonuclease VapC
MATILLDTGVASLLHPRKRNSTVRAAYEPTLRNELLAISFQTVAELYLWAEQHRWGVAQREALENFFSRFVIFPYERDVARVWAVVMTQARARGRRLEAGDAWIAATAIQRSIPLVTHDKDFEGLRVEGLRVICHA